MKTAFLFPGQGSQYVGMGKDFYDKYSVSKNIYEMASDVTGINVLKLCFEDNEDINKTEYTQLAMLATELAMYEAVKAEGINCEISAGLSLGEYASLVVSGALEYEDAFRIIRQRGLFMQNAVPVGGAMAAVLNFDVHKAEVICKELCDSNLNRVEDSGLNYIVSVANYNSPAQFVITGSKDAVTDACLECEKEGALKCVELNVSGPFHSKLLVDAGKKLGDELNKITLNEIKIPYITNVNASIVDNKDEVINLLVKQISSSVMWQQSMEKLIADGIEEFVEIGPGKTLSGFMRKIDKNYTVKRVNTVDDLMQIIG